MGAICAKDKVVQRPFWPQLHMLYQQVQGDTQIAPIPASITGLRLSQLHRSCPVGIHFGVNSNDFIHQVLRIIFTAILEVLSQLLFTQWRLGCPELGCQATLIGHNVVNTWLSAGEHPKQPSVSPIPPKKQ